MCYVPIICPVTFKVENNFMKSLQNFYLNTCSVGRVPVLVNICSVKSSSAFKSKFQTAVILHTSNFIFEDLTLTMWKECAPILSILLWCIIIDKSEAPSAASAAASAAAVATGTTDPDPVPQDPVVQLAELISDGLLHSEVFGDLTNFQLKDPYDLFFLIGTHLLDKAGIDDPTLAKVVADAAKEVAAKLGSISSKFCFDAVGYTLATFLFDRGIVTTDNAEYLALQILTSIEVVACKEGLIDTQSMFDAIAYGFFYVLDSYGVINYEYIADLFYLFAALMKERAGIAFK